MKKLTIDEIKNEFRELIVEDKNKPLDYEQAWATLNGLVVAYYKAKGEYFQVKEDQLSEGIRKVLLSLPKYDLGFKGSYELNKEDKAYLALCPAELVSGLTYKDINEKTVMDIAEKVIKFSAEKGVVEGGKMLMPDKKVSEASMAEFLTMDNYLMIKYDEIIAEWGEEAMKRALQQYQKSAEKAVSDEIDYHTGNANYLVRFFSNILIHSKDDSEIESA